MYMEGVLWKWTNYFSGWQSRWFVLDNGILSYYKSQDDVNNGCKGSVNLSVCNIVVHNTDHARLDLIIPGEQHFYIRASTAQERQRWLIALGTAKASMVPGRNTDTQDNLSPDIVRSKKSELRLYCDLLMQQVHSVKMATEDTGSPDLEKLSEATSLLGPTCDTFIQTLEECMKLVQVNNAFDGSHQHITDATAPPPSPLKLPVKKNRQLRRSNSTDSHRSILVHSAASRSSSISSTLTPSHARQAKARTRQVSESSLTELVIPEQSLEQTRDQTLSDTQLLNSSNSALSSAVANDNGVLQPGLKDSEVEVSQYTSSQETEVRNASDLSQSETQSGEDTDTVKKRRNSDESESSQVYVETSDQNGDVISSDGDLFLDPIEDRLPTFFSVMKPSFLDLRFTSDGGIPVEHFLGACKSLLPVFDKLNATAFAPVKMDFQGNIRKVRQKFSMNPDGFPTLQSIIVSEIQNNQQKHPNSATMALLWMKRSLEFIVGLMAELRNGEENVGTAASKAYANSLKPFHGWVVRGVFAVASKALPYRSVFLSLLGPDEQKMEGTLFEQSLMSDVDAFITALEIIIRVLHDFFKLHYLDIDETV